MLQEGRSLLEKASASGKTPSVKAAAAEAFAVLAFVGSEHPSDTMEVVQHLQSLWKGAQTLIAGAPEAAMLWSTRAHRQGNTDLASY